VSKPKVLVVDDNDITRKLVRITLTSEGYGVIEASDGASALRALIDERPDLVLQDLVLPDIGGIELVERLRNEPQGAGIPILAFSGFQSEMELADKLRVGFTDFLFKPVEPTRLTQVVQAYLPIDPGLPPVRTTTARVVLVDDDPVQLKLTSLRLQRQGYRVTVAHDGREALEAVRKVEPDAVISDVLMPVMDGFTFCLAVKRDPALSKIPVVLTTSIYTEPGDRDLADQIGAFDLVHRTPDLKDVLASLEKALTSAGSPAAAAKASPDSDREVPTAAYLQRVVRQLERQAEQNLSHSVRVSLLESELALLGAISEQLAAEAPLEQMLPELLQRCLDSAGLSSGVIWRLDNQAPRILAELGIRLGHRLDPETYVALAERLAPGAAPRLIRNGNAAAEQRDALERLEARSLLVTPLELNGQVTGGMLLASTQLDLDGDWPLFARTIANHVSNALAQANARVRLEKSEDRHRHLAEGVPVGIFEADEQGRCTYANTRLQAIWGRALPQMLGTGWQQGLRPEDLTRLMSERAQAFRENEELSMEVPVTRPDGTERWAVFRASPHRSADGTLIGVTGSVLDITEQRAAAAAYTAAIEARQRETQLLLDIGQSLLSEDDVQGFLEESIDRVLAAGQYDLSTISAPSGFLTRPSGIAER
jgi:PAS domain S-box-containing protein